MADPEQLTRAATQPIPGEQPAGAPARYEPTFIALESEIGKLESLEGGTVDWPQVEQQALTILTEQSKDLLVAAYLAFGLQQQGGLAGLEQGLILLRDLMATFWDDMQPPLKRLRARKSALQWFADRAGRALSDQIVVTAEDAAALQRCAELTEALHTSGSERFDDAESGFGALVRALREVGQMNDTQSGDGGEAVAATTEAGAPPAAAPVAGATGPIANRADALKRLRQLIDYFKQTEPHSPMASLLERALRWGDMDFQDVFSELLANNRDVKRQVFEVLGIKTED